MASIQSIHFVGANVRITIARNNLQFLILQIRKKLKLALLYRIIGLVDWPTLH